MKLSKNNKKLKDLKDLEDLKNLLAFHQKGATSSFLAFERIDNILHPFSADKIYNDYLEHLKYIEVVKSLLKRKS